MERVRRVGWPGAGRGAAEVVLEGPALGAGGGVGGLEEVRGRGPAKIWWGGRGSEEQQGVGGVGPGGSRRGSEWISCRRDIQKVFFV